MKHDEIVSWFHKHNLPTGYTMAELCKALDAPPNHLRHKVAALVKEGKLSRTGGKRGPGVKYAFVEPVPDHAVGAER